MNSQVAMAERPRIWTRPAKLASDDPNWHKLPVEGSARWRRMTGQARARRIRAAILILIALAGFIIGYFG